jgi:cysteine synthase
VSEEGLFVGISSGAAMCEAVHQATMMERGTVMVIFPDRGDRYLSTECFSHQQQDVPPSGV